MATSKYVGVRAERGIWRADIQVNKKKKFLGYFKSEVTAAQAYNDAIVRMGLKRKQNTIIVATPKTGGMQLMSGRSVLFQSLGITSVSVEVSHKKLILLKDAIKLGINDYINSNTKFSAFDVTTWIRNKSRQGDFALIDVPFHFENEWIQKIDHDKVRETVHELHANKDFSATKRDTGIYISYIP